MPFFGTFCCHYQIALKTGFLYPYRAPKGGPPPNKAQAPWFRGAINSLYGPQIPVKSPMNGVLDPPLKGPLWPPRPPRTPRRGGVRSWGGVKSGCHGKSSCKTPYEKGPFLSKPRGPPWWRTFTPPLEALFGAHFSIYFT